jgi:hypothetical protein
MLAVRRVQLSAWCRLPLDCPSLATEIAEALAHGKALAVRAWQSDSLESAHHLMPSYLCLGHCTRFRSVSPASPAVGLSVFLGWF